MAVAVTPIPEVYLRRVVVRGFRGIGPPATLELQPGPGLTLVLGRTGSGKTSLAEGLELCLGGTGRRAGERPAAWREGWRNRDRGGDCELVAELCVEGLPGPVRVARSWGEEDDPGDGGIAVTGPPGAVEAPGWAGSIAGQRPFLSADELGRLSEEGPDLPAAIAASPDPDGLAAAAAAYRLLLGQGEDADGAGLAGLSRGELCSLALSLFLARAGLDEGPFRFVVLDDPVQALDPARVDGLARALAKVAERRQAIVFTHDDRLAQAVRRLRIPARALRVARGPGSALIVEQAAGPIEAAIADARAVAGDSELPAEVAARVVPGLCRQAIEAACAESVRRRRIANGDPHEEVEALLEGVTGLYQWVALALFDDPGSAAQARVLSRLNNSRQYGPFCSDALRQCSRGAHAPYNGPLPGLIARAERFARALAGDD